MADKFEYMTNMTCGHGLFVLVGPSYPLPIIAEITNPYLNFKMAAMMAILIFKMAAIGFSAFPEIKSDFR